MQIGATTITESVEEKLLGVTLDKKLDFKNHVNTLCKKAGQKLHAACTCTYFKLCGC